MLCFFVLNVAQIRCGIPDGRVFGYSAGCSVTLPPYTAAVSVVLLNGCSHCGARLMDTQRLRHGRGKILKSARLKIAQLFGLNAI